MPRFCLLSRLMCILSLKFTHYSLFSFSLFSIFSFSSSLWFCCSWSICLNCDSDFISIFQFVNLAANLAFCPALPIANDNWSSGTITSANLSSSFISTARICAGNNADAMNILGSSSHSITSNFTPCKSFNTFRNLTP